MFGREGNSNHFLTFTGNGYEVPSSLLVGPWIEWIRILLAYS